MNILVIGRNKESADTIVRLIKQQDSWNASAAITDQEALRLFVKENIELVLIGGGVDENSEKSLTIEFEKKDPDVKVIRHFGGGSGLLFNEIQEALRKP
jgi:hypothetical protein